MRFIEKIDENTYGALVADYLVYEKLCQLEDIEEELGIDLLTLFKALKNGFVDCLNEYHHFSNLYFSDEEIFDGYTHQSYNIKDYGKTWALTKEELL